MGKKKDSICKGLFGNQLLLFLLLIVLVSSKALGQQSVSLYVGQETLFSAPDPPYGALNQVAWGSRHGSVSVSNYMTYGAKVKVLSYFEGSAEIFCDYYYYTYDNYGGMHLGNSRAYYYVYCKSVDCRLSPTSMTLNVGEGQTLTYTLSPNISPTPTVRFYSNNTNIVTVNSSGYVKAIGPGTTTITVENSAGPPKTCSVKVNDVPVSEAIVSSPINAIADESKSLSVSVYPTNARIKTSSWYIKEGESIVSLTSSGLLTGKKPGTAKVYCIVNGDVTSNTAIVNVSEPSFTKSSSSPSANATNVSAFVTPSVTYSLALYKGDKYSSIKLKNNDTGKDVEGTVSISNKTVTFSPTKPLDELTNYTLSIPANAVKNKWDTHYSSPVSIPFKTGEWEKLSLTASMKSCFVSVGDKVNLTASVSKAKIYYTTDGSTPSTKSALYTEAIVFEKDTKLRAIAKCDGYKDSEILSEDYLITNVNVIAKFPNEEMLYIYQDVNPYIRFSNAIEKSVHLEDVKLTKNGKENIPGEIIVADSSIFFIPEEPLELGCKYQISIPEDAIKTWQGESNHATNWSFSTGDYATSIVMNSPELAASFKTDGSFLTWGTLYQSGNTVDGSYTTKDVLSPDKFMKGDDIRVFSSGYMHHAIVKTDGSLWMWGRQYCGEFGNNSTTGSATPVKIMDGVVSVSAGGQTTAIIKSDGTLWMCGRNDFGQIGDSSTITRKQLVKVMDDVVSAKAGWCTSYAIKDDNSLWAWGRNDHYQFGNGMNTDSLAPSKVLDDVAVIEVSATESGWVAAIKTDGSLWVWGNLQPTPKNVLNNVCDVAVGADYVEALMDDGTLWAFGMNDYGQLGDGTNNKSDSPIRIMDGVLEVESGGQTTMIRRHNGSVWTWGRNNYGTLGNGEDYSLTSYSISPYEVIEGRKYSELEGIIARKNVYHLLNDSLNVIDALPVPLTANYNSIQWKSNNSNIVTVTERGVLMGHSSGETDVVVTICDNNNEYSMTCHVIVGEASGIDEVIADDNYTNRGIKKGVYTITGVKLADELSELQGLTPGVYIINGKKVMVK